MDCLWLQVLQRGARMSSSRVKETSVSQIAFNRVDPLVVLLIGVYDEARREMLVRDPRPPPTN